MLDYDAWIERAPALSRAFRAATPFPHLVLDDFLPADVAERACDEFTALEADEAGWIAYWQVNQRKHGLSDRARFTPTLRAVVDELTTDRFAALLSAATGLPGLRADPEIHGGGLHSIRAGGFLNLHVDFTGHPNHPTWRRKLNFLWYLNRGWRESYQGHLELWNRGATACVTRIAPLFNRAVVFATGRDWPHGHPVPLACPPAMTRKSLALYYFQDEARAVRYEAPLYLGRPGDGARHLLIGAENVLLRAYHYLRPRLGLDDVRVGRVLASFSRWRRRRR